MSATRLGLFDGRLLTLFPRQLQNTAVSPTLLVKDRYARLLENILPNTNKAGSGAKRYGMGARGAELTGLTVTDAWEYRKSDGTLQIVVYCSDGTLWTLDEGSNVYTNIRSGLSTLGTVGAIPFNNKLVFWNGIDPCFSWNGSNCVNLAEYVEDVLCTAETQVDASSFTIKPGVDRGASDYPVGRAIRVTFSGGAGTVSATVAGTSYNSGNNVLTISVTGTPLPNPTQTITKVEYQASPPAFSFMFVHLDMLWGLSPGELRSKVWRGFDGMKAYYQAALNNENSWYDYAGTTPTQDVPYINLTNKAIVSDELVAMSSIDGAAVFHGRNQLYIYTGSDPNTVGGFIYSKTIPVGTVHQKLVQRFPGDTLFMTPYGARSLTRVFQTEQLDVQGDLGSDIDPTIQARLVALMADDTAYKKARSFFYARDGLYGFKLDDTGTLIYVLSEESKGWVTFTGFFADARAFLGTSDGRLMIGRGSQLYAYANGSDSVVGVEYSDAGTAILCKWWSPWIQVGGRWSNQAWEVIMEDVETSLFYIDRFINFNPRDVVTLSFNVTSDGARWDEGMWDVNLWDGVPVNPVALDKFLADSFSFMLRHETTTGPLNVLGVRPIGR
ncbi:hypothetical protein [Mesorhizobium sp. B2-3-4]|uniref:hypothetical protein n=1 Tax=Mesorhizobium sp. B2-3-4 TaxID=2589959 RepID=UPI00112BC06D|nr:hypothetical protein [Mesorhizobium sp. B2-3-4]TPM41419.1 hypothetical protein FJ967_00330 [Mesorhizobium sp. B2-3-4]